MPRWPRRRVDAALSLDRFARLSPASLEFPIPSLAHRDLLWDSGRFARSEVVFPLLVGGAALAPGLRVVGGAPRKALIPKTGNALTPGGRGREFPANGGLSHVAL